MSQRSDSSKQARDDRSESARSTSSRSSTKSSRTTVSMAVAMAQAKADAAQARAAHAEREIQLKVEQARIQANLEALNEEKEKDAAIAEANTLVAGLQDMGFEVRSEIKSVPYQAVKDQRTAAFVADQASSRREDAFAAAEYDVVSPSSHSARSGMANAIPSASRVLMGNQAAASEAVTAHQVRQGSHASGAPPQPFLYSAPAPQLRGASPQRRFKKEPSIPFDPLFQRTQYGASHDRSMTTADFIRRHTRWLSLTLTQKCDPKCSQASHTSLEM
ncbi:hypothetical protein SRHO_G00340780 [Serrasalmus rhombeus]